MAIIRQIGTRVLGWVWRQLHQGRCRGCTGGHVCLFTHPQSGSSILNVLHRHTILLLHCCLRKTLTLPGAMIYTKHKSSSHSQPMQSHPFSVHYLTFRGLFTEQGPAAHTDMPFAINHKLYSELWDPVSMFGRIWLFFDWGFCCDFWIEIEFLCLTHIRKQLSHSWRKGQFSLQV